MNRDHRTSNMASGKPALSHRNLLREKVEGWLWLPAFARAVVVVIVFDGIVAEIKAFAFGSG